MLRINEIIQKSGYKRGFLAQKMGISPTTLLRWCTGETIPDALKLKKLSEILNVDINDFFSSK